MDREGEEERDENEAEGRERGGLQLVWKQIIFQFRSCH